jgi:hypothetical protein
MANSLVIFYDVFCQKYILNHDFQHFDQFLNIFDD